MVANNKISANSCAKYLLVQHLSCVSGYIISVSSKERFSTLKLACSGRGPMWSTAGMWRSFLLHVTSAECFTAKTLTADFIVI